MGTMGQWIPDFLPRSGRAGALMLGHSHAISGVASAAVVSELVLKVNLPHAGYLIALTAGFAVLPDIDHCGTSVARSFGFMSEGFAWVVEKLSGGHRHGTHSIIGTAVFTGAVWAGALFQRYLPVKIALGLFLALAIAAGLRALRIAGHLGDVLAIAGAAGIVWSGYGLNLYWHWPASWHWIPGWAQPGLPFVALACALGCATHIIGDMLTEEGCPLAWPFTKFCFKWWPRPLAFRTGTRPELWGVVPALLVVIAWMAWHAASTVRFTGV